MLKIYLAGAIRGPEDYRWRQIVTERYAGKATMLSPSDIGVDVNELRNFGGSAYMTFRTDLHLIDTADCLIVNLSALDDGYPCIGTIMEVGYALKAGKHILTYCSEKSRTHPFIAFSGAGVFTLWNDLFRYLDGLLVVHSGSSPIFNDLMERPVRVGGCAK